ICVFVVLLLIYYLFFFHYFFYIFFFFFFFFFNDTATTEIYTLSLHDALPIYDLYYYLLSKNLPTASPYWWLADFRTGQVNLVSRSEEHTSELQSQSNLVCRLLLEKKKKKK